MGPLKRKGIVIAIHWFSVSALFDRYPFIQQQNIPPCLWLLWSSLGFCYMLLWSSPLSNVLSKQLPYFHTVRCLLVSLRFWKDISCYKCSLLSLFSRGGRDAQHPASGDAAQRAVAQTGGRLPRAHHQRQLQDSKPQSEDRDSPGEPEHDSGRAIIVCENL